MEYKLGKVSRVKIGGVDDPRQNQLVNVDMCSERSVGYLARMHERCTENFGEQSMESRIAQIPELSKQLLEDVVNIANQHDDYTNIPLLHRLEVRQKISLAVQLELMSIY